MTSLFSLISTSSILLIADNNISLIILELNAGSSTRKTFEIIEGEKLVDRARHLGQILVAALTEIAAKHPEIGEIRGRGAMIAIELLTQAKKVRSLANVNLGSGSAPLPYTDFGQRFVSLVTVMPF